MFFGAVVGLLCGSAASLISIPAQIDTMECSYCNQEGAPVVLGLICLLQQRLPTMGNGAACDLHICPARCNTFLCFRLHKKLFQQQMLFTISWGKESRAPEGIKGHTLHEKIGTPTMKGGGGGQLHHNSPTPPQ